MKKIVKVKESVRIAQHFKNLNKLLTAGSQREYNSKVMKGEILQ